MQPKRTLLATTDDLVNATAGRITHRTARRRMVQAGGRRVGRRVYVSTDALRCAFGVEFGDAVEAAVAAAGKKREQTDER